MFSAKTWNDMPVVDSHCLPDDLTAMKTELERFYGYSFAECGASGCIRAFQAMLHMICGTEPHTPCVRKAVHDMRRAAGSVACV